MKEEDKVEKWDAHHLPFAEGYATFASIPKEKRSDYRKMVLQIKQIDSPPPVVFRKDYPQSGKLQHEGY